MRGDEPAAVVIEEILVVEFPACAGMNRLPSRYCPHVYGVPRMRGDEPRDRTWKWYQNESSPHARG